MVLVCNAFINDKRVLQVSESLLSAGYVVTVIAAKEVRGLTVSEKKPLGEKTGCENLSQKPLFLNIIRVPLFSSLYSKRGREQKKKSLELRVEKKDCPQMNTNKRSQMDTDKSLELRVESLEKKKRPKKSITNLQRVSDLLKNNKIRMILVSFLNWFSFNSGAFIFGLYHRPSVVYCNDLNTLTVGHLIAKIFRSRILYDSHELWLDGGTYQKSTFIRKWMWQKLEHSLIKRVNEVIVTTPMRAQILQDRYKIPHINVIRNTPHFQDIKDRTLLREGIADDSVLFLYCGSLNLERGILMILEVIERIEDAYLIYMGNGNGRLKLISEIEKRNLSSRIFVRKPVPPLQVVQYAASADVGLQLLPNININHYSTISNKLLEYIMAECGVIASDFPEIRKIVISNQVGLVVDPQDKEAIFNACLELVRNREKLQLFKKNCGLIKKDYCWEQDEKLLLKLVNGSGKEKRLVLK